MLNRNSQYRKAMRIKQPKRYISVNDLDKYTQYSVEKYNISYGCPIITLQKQGIKYIVFLPEKYAKWRIDTNKKLYFEYFGDSIINSNLEFVIYEYKET